MLYICALKHNYVANKRMMVSRDALEKVVKEDMAGIWNVLTSEEKRVVIDNFTIHNYKRNQIIYAEKETPEYLWCLEGKGEKIQGRDRRSSADYPLDSSDSIFRASGIFRQRAICFGSDCNGAFCCGHDSNEDCRGAD